MVEPPRLQAKKSLYTVAMRRFNLGAHTKSDLKMHQIWTLKYRKMVLTVPVAVRVRDVLRQIASKHEPEIITGKIESNHVHGFLSHRPNQEISKIVQ